MKKVSPRQTQNLTLKNKSPARSFETSYEPIQQCIVLDIVDVEGMSPFFLLRHPQHGSYRVNITKTGIHVTR